MVHRTRFEIAVVKFVGHAMNELTGSVNPNDAVTGLTRSSTTPQPAIGGWIEIRSA